MNLQLIEMSFIENSQKEFGSTQVQSLPTPDSVFALTYPVSLKVGFNEFASLPMIAKLNGKKNFKENLQLFKCHS